MLVKENRHGNETPDHECFHFAILSQLIALLVNSNFFFYNAWYYMYVSELLQWGQLNQCAYSVCNSMQTKAKHKILSMQRYSIK